MNFSFIQYRQQEKLARIRLNRPEKRNALNRGMIAELGAAFETAAAAPGVKVILLEASGEVFSAGADLEYLLELQRNSNEENLADSRRLKALFLQIYTCPKLVIAQVQGHAIAGGCGLVTVCDLVYSEPEARFGYTECKIGFVPALVAGFLLRRTGEGKARELLLSGSLITAREAQSYGLVNYISAPGQLEQEAGELAEKLATETSGASVAYTKELLATLGGMPLGEGLELAAGLNAKARQGEDFKKGIQAFLNKENPRW